MLKYSVKLTENDFKKNSIIWREKYVASDLSFFSGVTSSSYHLERYNTISAISPLTNLNSVFTVETEVVTRLGYIIITDKEYPIKYVNNTPYVYINGRYFYGNGSSFTIKDWQCETFENVNGKAVPTIIEKDKTVYASGGKIVLPTIYWIENGYVTIDGSTYIFDKNEYQENGTKGCLKYLNDGMPINNLGDVSYAPYRDPSLIHDVCKFKAYATPFVQYKPKDIKFCERIFYIKYLDYYCPIVPKDNAFACQVPINGDIRSISELPVYASTDDDTSIIQVSIGNDIQDINDLVKYKCFVEINGFKYFVSDDYRETSSSRLIMIMLENQGATIDVGNDFTFVCSSNGDETYLKLESDGSVIYDGNKYIVESKLFDKAVINDNEYDVTYDDLNSNIAYVNIDNERVPMKLNGDTLTRYGLVVKNANSRPTSETSSINHYSGVTIEGKNYIVKDDYAQLTIPNKIKFTVEEVKGNSLFICKASINPNEYSSEFAYNKQIELANEVVNNQSLYALQVNNNVLGSKPISKESVFSSVQNPTSSDDAYGIFDNLTLEDNNSYINLPLNFNIKVGNNLLQSELIKKDFCEKEKEKRINKIVDLEKDVYSPKLMISENYSGSNTDFSTVQKIVVNLHFRTRDMSNWKVNEGYNDVSVSGVSDNWFITDYEPYRSMIENANETQLDKMFEMSDVLGLLYFDNDDVFYQKSKISKSFLRFSFYDSIDPQTQSLLATSTVFMDEHSLYKKYIDNSRKGINQYVNFAEKIDECLITNKIRTNSERLANRSESAQCESGEDFVTVSYSGESGESESYCISLKEDGKRLDSRFIIENKYSTESSSEGFYIYMFREYGEKLHPKPIYMKVEFNHAGIGKTIPFVVPMDWRSNSGDSDSDDVYPTSALTFADDGLEELKRGVPLSWVYAQSYIPLYAVYDFKNKEYAYVFDDRYIRSGEDNSIHLNLFEIKVREDDEENSTAVINIEDRFYRDEENT